MGTVKIPVASPVLDEEDLKTIIEVFKTGFISGVSPIVAKFEQEFANWLGVRFAIACSSGTAALHLALLALGIGPGDEVIVPDLTFAAPVNVIIHVGAKPVIVDVTRDYWCIDPRKIEKCITSRTKAIIVVHLYGHPADMDPILEIAEKFGLYVIEDCAEAHGALYKGRKVGTIGHIACFSFFANKIITTGEGGIVTTNDSEIAEKLRLYRDHGMNPRYWHVVPGLNYRMTGLQAALGVSQLRKIDKLIEWKRKIAKIYEEELSNIEEIAQLHPEQSWARCVYWLYSIILKSEKIRNTLAERLNAHGIETRRFFYPIHIQPAYNSKIIIPEKPENSLYLSERGLSLPSGPDISYEEVLTVANTIKKVLTEEI